MIETAAKRRRPRPPVQGCAAVDRRSGIRDCTGCGYYRPLSADLLLGMACHYSLDTGQLREVPPAVCFRRALHRARRPGPGRPRKQREEVSDMTPKTAQDPPAVAGAQSASPSPAPRAKMPTGQGVPDAGETPPAPIARRQTARRDTGAAPAPTPDKEAASAKPPVSANAPAKASKKPRRKTAGKSVSPEKTPAPAVKAIPGNIDPPTNPLAPAAGEARAKQNTAETAGIPAETSAPAAGDVPAKTDIPTAGETPAKAPAKASKKPGRKTAGKSASPEKPPAPAAREIPAGGIFTESPAGSRAGQGREETAGENPNAARRTALCPAAFASPASQDPAPQGPGASPSAPQDFGSPIPASGERASQDPAPQGPGASPSAPQDFGSPSPASGERAPQDPAPQGPGSSSPAPQEPAPREPAPKSTAPQDPASQTPAGKGPAEKLEQLLERAAPAAVEALLRTVQDERASCAQRLDAAKILLERAAPRAGGGEGVLRVVLEDGAAELIE